MYKRIREVTLAAFAFGSLLIIPGAHAAGDGYSSLNGGTTGGQGGQVVFARTGTEIHSALCNRANNNTPIIIHVEGTINHGNTSKVSGSCNTADDKIEIKDVSNITIEGVGDGALFDELGIHVRNASNIILRNLHVRNVKKSGSPTSNGGDAIGMEADVSNVWVDHVTLEASGGENDGYDALFDLKNNTRYVTLSYSILRNSGRGGLVGSSDSDDSNGPITYHHNIFQNIESRTPLLRYATAHFYNNWLNGIEKSGMNPRIGGRIKAENNYVENANDPLGTFYTDDLGYWDVSGNIFTSTVNWSDVDSENYPAGPNPSSTTSIQIPYNYALDRADCVPQLLGQVAGANKGLRTSNGSCIGGGSSSSSSASSNSSASSSASTSSSSSSSSASSTGRMAGDNLSIGAGSDGSSKASGTSYGNVRDGDEATYWSPSGSTGRVSIKWSSPTTVSTVVIKEAAGFAGNIGNWQLVNNDNGNVLASGSGAGVISFGEVTLSKINFEIGSANGTPAVAEFETYYGDLDETDPGEVTLASSVNGADVDLFWTISGIDVRVAEMYRDTDANPQGRLRIANVTGASTFTDMGLSNGVYYYWLKVTATDGTITNSDAAAASVNSVQVNPPLVIEEYESGFCGVQQGVVETEHAGYSGNGYANTDNASGNLVSYAFTAQASGNYDFAVRFANGSSSRPAVLRINGSDVASVNFVGTGAWGNYQTMAITNTALGAGNHTLQLVATGDAGLPNIDHLVISSGAQAVGSCP